jgi:hypothetical protein
MPRIQVTGLELVQYQGEGLPQILVPRFVGQTEASRAGLEVGITSEMLANGIRWRQNPNLTTRLASSRP